MNKRGIVLRETNMGPGLLTVEGKQYSFLLEGMWRSEVPPRSGMAVDVGFDETGAPAEVYAVPEAQVAKEQAQKALSSALRQGPALSGSVGASVRSDAGGRMGTAAIAAEVIMLLSFSTLPNLRIESLYFSHVFSGWEAIAYDPAISLTSHGLLSLVAIVCLFAPVAPRFLSQDWGRWLYAAPLAFAVLACVTVASEVQSAEHAASSAVGDLFGSQAARAVSRQMTGGYSFGVGAYIVILCSIYLFTRAFRRA